MYVQIYKFTCTFSYLCTHTHNHTCIHTYIKTHSHVKRFILVWTRFIQCVTWLMHAGMSKETYTYAVADEGAWRVSFIWDMSYACIYKWLIHKCTWWHVRGMHAAREGDARWPTSKRDMTRVSVCICTCDMARSRAAADEQQSKWNISWMTPFIYTWMMYFTHECNICVTWLCHTCTYNDTHTCSMTLSHSVADSYV